MSSVCHYEQEAYPSTDPASSPFAHVQKDTPFALSARRRVRAHPERGRRPAGAGCQYPNAGIDVRLRARRPGTDALGASLYQYVIENQGANWSFEEWMAKETTHNRQTKIIAGKLAEIKNISVEEVASQTTENAKRLFKL